MMSSSASGSLSQRIGILFLTTFLVVLLLSYNNNYTSYTFEKPVQQLISHDVSPTQPSLQWRLPILASNETFGLKVLDRDYHFNPANGSDVMVFLEIQKTGTTTFGRHLVQNLGLCKCKGKRPKCDCSRPGNSREIKRLNRLKRYWLFNRYSTSWQHCGVHADWTELTNCVPRFYGVTSNGTEEIIPRFYYITMLRNPIKRYISEWQHVRRGATWKQSLHKCDDRLPTLEEIPPCYDSDDWKNVTLDEFINCKSNLASNRQTRMLADLSLVGCYDTSKMSVGKRNHIMLRSAKKNLKSFAFFGITENQTASQYIFERTFKMHFNKSFDQLETNADKSTVTMVTPKQYDKIKQLNLLDIELYKFAKSLFFQRKTNWDAKEKDQKT